MLYVEDTADVVRVNQYYISDSPSQPLNNPNQSDYCFLGIDFNKRVGRTQFTFHYIGEWVWSTNTPVLSKVEKDVVGTWYKTLTNKQFGFELEDPDDTMNTNLVFIDCNNVYFDSTSDGYAKITYWYYTYSAATYGTIYQGIAPTNSYTGQYGDTLPYLYGTPQYGTRYCYSNTAFYTMVTNKNNDDNYISINLVQYT